MSDKLKDAGKRGVQSQSIINARNYPVTQFFCGVNTEWLGIKVKYCCENITKKLNYEIHMLWYSVPVIRPNGSGTPVVARHRIISHKQY